MATDKKILNRGISSLMIALPLVFIGPTLIHFAFINKQQPLFPVILGVGVLLGIVAIILIFKGIITVIKSMTDN